MGEPGGDPLAAAALAAAAGDWATARTGFAAVVERDPIGEALAGLGDAQWWLGETEAAVRHQEQAYAAFRHRGDDVQSVVVAVALYLVQRVSLGNVAAARGWLARAKRLVEECDLAPLRGWVSLIRAHDSADPAAAEALAIDARKCATRLGDSDLELCAISQLGAVLVRTGRQSEGTALLDEAMAAGLAGEAKRPHTVVYVGCNLVSACAETAQVEHLVEWVHAADTFSRRFGGFHLHTTCRTSLGIALFAAGDFAGAEHELREALRVGAAAEPAVYAEAAARLAELRLVQGRPDEAAGLLDGLEAYVTSSYPLAMLAITRGDPASARRLAFRRARELQGALDDGAEDRRDSYRPGLGPCVEAALVWELLATVGCDDETVVEHLCGLADETDCEQLRARALRAAGRMHGDIRELEQALRMFGRLRLPLEAARTRLRLSWVLDGDDAVDEARAALAAFEGLGAGHDADEAAARLRQLGVRAARGGPAHLGELTQREREVLTLLGQGLSNRELADRLFLSRKTVERHVRNVLFKLGLRNRAEAAAYVVRHEDAIRSGN